MTPLKQRATFALLILILIAVIISFNCCTTTKHITKDTTEQTDRSAQVRDSFTMVLASVNMKHQSELQEARKSAIVFKEVPCPVFPLIDSTCNKDSLVKIIHTLMDYQATLKNTVTIEKDGRIRAQGNISSISQDLQKTQKEADELNQTNSELSHFQDSVIHEQSKKQTVVTKDVKRKWFTGWVMWLVFLVAGCGIGWYGKSKIKMT